MATTRLDPAVSPASPPRPPARGDNASRAAEAQFDPIAELLALATPPATPAPGLADQMLDYALPQPRDPRTLTPGRIPVLLAAAARLLTARAASGDTSRATAGDTSRATSGDTSRAASGETPSVVSDDIARLGAGALAQELRAHLALAERRATLIDA